MNWIELIGAVGIGAIITKILDVLWLQRLLAQQEKARWLRETKFRALSNLSKLIASWGFHEGKVANLWEFRAAVAEAFLVIENRKLVEEIQTFSDDLWREDEESTGRPTPKSLDERGLKVAKETYKKEVRSKEILLGLHKEIVR